MPNTIDGQSMRHYRDHPVKFVKDVIGAAPTRAQRDILLSVSQNRMTSVRSGHGVGKSAVASWAILWFLCTRQFPKIPCTAPTRHQLFDVLWAEISKWIRSSEPLRETLVWTQDRIFFKGKPEEWFAAARTAAVPDALQGFHAEHMLFVIDEASGVPDRVFEPVLGALSTPGARLLMCGNPTRTSGFFYDSHHKNRASYRTFHIDARESSRVSPEFSDGIIALYGEDSDVFRVRVAGEFPLQAGDAFIPLPLIERSIALGREAPDGGPPGLIHIGCDVARFGLDQTVIGCRVGARVTFFQKRRGQDTMKTADSIVELGDALVARHLWPGKIPVKIDDSGVGGGVVDRLKQLKRGDPERFAWLDLHPVTFGTRIQNRHYHDTTSYMAGIVRELLSDFDESGPGRPPELILPDDAHLAAQLSSRKYRLTDAGRIQLESKEAMRKRGLPSPDEADCLMLCCLPLRKTGDSESHNSESFGGPVGCAIRNVSIPNRLGWPVS